MATLSLVPAILFSTRQIEHLLGDWGYGLVLLISALQSAGVPVPGTTALAAAAVYAGTTHHLAIAGVVVAASLGAIIGYAIGFALGRWGGWPLLANHGHRIGLTSPRLKLGRYFYEHHGFKVVVVGRFISGLRTWGGIVAGANRMPASRFMPANVIGAVAWALVHGLGYFYFGHLIVTASTEVQVLLALAGGSWIVASLLYLRRRGSSLQLAAERAYPGELEA